MVRGTLRVFTLIVATLSENTMRVVTLSAFAGGLVPLGIVWESLGVVGSLLVRCVSVV
jgi:hypothetical protein